MRRRSYFDRVSHRAGGRLGEIIAMQRGVIRDHIHLIASACFPFPSVLRTLSEPAFVLPAEGMPGARYLPGAEVMDVVENEGEALTLSLFGAPTGYRASLQPHSGTQANQIAYNAILQPGDKVLSLRPKDGGHISHTVLLSRRHESVYYDLTQTGELDYDSLWRVAERVRPKLIIVGGSALPRAIDFKTCGAIADKTGAYLHADISHTATFVAAGLHPDVFPYCDFVTFSMSKNLRGPNSAIIIYRDIFYEKISRSIFPVTQGGANETNMLGKFAALQEWQSSNLRDYARSIQRATQLLGQVLEKGGLDLITGGTDCHLLLAALPEDAGSGADAERRLEAHGILANKNLVPGDRRGPKRTSGIRFGGTNLAILNYKDADIERLGQQIVKIILDGSGDRRTIRDLIQSYPPPIV